MVGFHEDPRIQGHPSSVPGSVEVSGNTREGVGEISIHTSVSSPVFLEISRDPG